jgi:hypothetical protein
VPDYTQPLTWSQRKRLEEAHQRIMAELRVLRELDIEYALLLGGIFECRARFPYALLSSYWVLGMALLASPKDSVERKTMIHLLRGLIALMKREKLRKVLKAIEHHYRGVPGEVLTEQEAREVERLLRNAFEGEDDGGAAPVT